MKDCTQQPQNEYIHISCSGRRNQLYKQNWIDSAAIELHGWDATNYTLQIYRRRGYNSSSLSRLSTKTWDRPSNDLSSGQAVPWSVAYIAVCTVVVLEQQISCIGYDTTSRNQKQRKTIGAVLVTERKNWARSSNATITAIDKLVCLHGGRN